MLQTPVGLLEGNVTLHCKPIDCEPKKKYCTIFDTTIDGFLKATYCLSSGFFVSNIFSLFYIRRPSSLAGSPRRLKIEHETNQIIYHWRL